MNNSKPLIYCTVLLNFKNLSQRLMAFIYKHLALFCNKQTSSRPVKLRERPKGKQVQSEPDHQGQVVGGGIGHHEDVC